MVVPVLDKLAAYSLNLYRAIIDRSLDKKQRIEVLNNLYLNEEGMERDEREELSKYFGESPLKG